MGTTVISGVGDGVGGIGVGVAVGLVGVDVGRSVGLAVGTGVAVASGRGVAVAWATGGTVLVGVGVAGARPKQPLSASDTISRSSIAAGSVLKRDRVNATLLKDLRGLRGLRRPLKSLPPPQTP